MPTPPLSDEEAKTAWRFYVEHEHKIYTMVPVYNEWRKQNGLKEIAETTVNHHIKVARTRGFHLSDGARNAVDRARLNPTEARGGWIHDYDADGKKIGTTRWKAEEAAERDALERIRAAFEGMTPEQKIAPPESVSEDLCNVLPFFDVHWGMSAWGEETDDQDYDLKLARDDVMMGLESVLSTAPRADTCIMILGGDFLHSDNDDGLTYHSKHSLDMAGRQYQAIDSGIEIIKYATKRILQQHNRVVIRVLRGNHDPHSHRTISFALREWLADNERAEVDMHPREIFMRQWGRAAIFAQHGDKMKPNDLAHRIADICPFWSDAPHRHAYTGHKHQMAAQRIGGLNWERLEPFAPSDAYGASWVNRRGIKIDTYDKRRGRIATAIDPLERAA